MKKIIKAVEQFCGILMYAIALAAAVLTGIVLMPVIMLVVLVLAIREIIIWNKKKKQSSAPVEVEKTKVIIRTLTNRNIRRAA